MKKFFIILGVLFFIIIVGGEFGMDPPKPKSEEEKKLEQVEEKRIFEEDLAARLAKENKAIELLATQKKQEGLVWSYSDTPDKMGRGSVKFASIKSINTVSFKFPYAGAQRANLTLRKSPKSGEEAMLIIEKGQFLCNASECAINIKFDNGSVKGYTALGTDDNDSTTIFIRGYKGFLGGLKKAKKLYIEATFYQEGSQVFEFDVSGLKW